MTACHKCAALVKIFSRQSHPPKCRPEIGEAVAGCVSSRPTVLVSVLSSRGAIASAIQQDSRVRKRYKRGWTRVACFLSVGNCSSSLLHRFRIFLAHYVFYISPPFGILLVIVGTEASFRRTSQRGDGNNWTLIRFPPLSLLLDTLELAPKMTGLLETLRLHASTLVLWMLEPSIPCSVRAGGTT